METLVACASYVPMAPTRCGASVLSVLRLLFSLPPRVLLPNLPPYLWQQSHEGTLLRLPPGSVNPVCVPQHGDVVTASRRICAPAQDKYVSQVRKHVKCHPPPKSHCLIQHRLRKNVCCVVALRSPYYCNTPV